MARKVHLYKKPKNIFTKDETLCGIKPKSNSRMIIEVTKEMFYGWGKDVLCPKCEKAILKT